MVWIEKINNRVPVALTIAGSDSSGGAGIGADLKTFAAVGVHGTVALTSITAQNSFGVHGVQDVNIDIVKKQIDAVVQDCGVDAAKTGMLHTSEIIIAVAEKIRQYKFKVVVDPVMIAKSGAPLIKPEARASLKREIIPLATVVTPNKFEAEELSGVKIESMEDAKKAARAIADLGPQAVVVKGGHLKGNTCADVLYFEGDFIIYEKPRLVSNNTHGTGCCFSAAIAAYLAKGLEIPEAVKLAKNLVFEAIRHGLPVGKQFGSVNPLASLYKESEKLVTLESLEKALTSLNKLPRKELLMPEVRINFVYALPEAEHIEEVAAFPGRITYDGENFRSLAFPRFGASSHMANAIIAYMKYYPNVRSAINIKYDERILKAAKKAGFIISGFDRQEEPEEVRKREGATMPWGIKTALSKVNAPADVIFDLGGFGKEPLIKIFGKNPSDVIKKLQTILTFLESGK